MSICPKPTIIFTILLGLGFTITIAWSGLRIWYFRLVSDARSQVQDRDGKTVPGSLPKMLLGNLSEVYSAENQLSAYHSFHKRFGEVVQIFWLWRSQLSVSNYQIARRILVNNQKNYRKFPPNSLLQKLFGKSVLTYESTSNDWKRHRLLLNEVFSKKQVASFHHIFVDYSERLASKWHKQIEQSPADAQLDIYPELLALFLDIVGKVAIGKDFAALSGDADEFLEALKYIVYQSIQPAHQFTTWWKYLPLPSNYKLHRAFTTVDDFLARLIQQKKAMAEPNSVSVLDLLLRSPNFLETEIQSLTDKEIRDNLLAIIANGHETVATSVALTLYFLAQHPEKLTRAQAEVDRIINWESGKLTEAGVAKLDYLDCVILETLRFSPTMAGLQRISRARDTLEGWSIPAGQVVGITLEPLHRNPKYYGEKAEQFHPERYYEPELATVSVGATATHEAQSKCPVRRFLPSNLQNKSKTIKNGVHLPLTFGDGARKCLAEHFAMYEMKVTLAVMLYYFDFHPAPNFKAELELGKFGLFLTTFPQDGVKMLVIPRSH